MLRIEGQARGPAPTASSFLIRWGTRPLDGHEHVAPRVRSERRYDGHVALVEKQFQQVRVYRSYIAHVAEIYPLLATAGGVAQKLWGSGCDRHQITVHAGETDATCSVALQGGKQ